MTAMSEDLGRWAEEYRAAKELAEQAEQRRKDLRELILKKLHEAGEQDELGNRWLPADSWMMKAERRVSRKFNRDKAEEWLRSRGLWEEAKELIPEVVIPEHYDVTEDGFSGYLWENRAAPDLPPQIPEEVYDIKESFALRIDEEESYDY